MYAIPRLRFIPCFSRILSWAETAARRANRAFIRWQQNAAGQRMLCGLNARELADAGIVEADRYRLLSPFRITARPDQDP